MIKNFSLLLVSILSLYTLQAQDDPNITGQDEGVNAILTTVPFLTISPDSRAGAMGDAGAASSADLSSQHWNAAKYPFLKEQGGLVLSYTPWLKALNVNDLNLLYLSGFFKFDDRQTVSMGLRYFNLGTIEYTDINGESLGTGKPNEFALDAAYSRLFSEYFSGALAFRFIYSDISGSTGNLNLIEYNPGTSFAADIDLYYQRPLSIDGKDAQMAYGLAITNIGTKMSYSDGDTKEFIPTNLRLGGRFSIDLDDYNTIAATFDVNKLLVPTPPITDENDSIIAGKSDDVSTLTGMIQSFYDAPGILESDGTRNVFKEEMQEIMLCGGIEYWYRKQFAVRAGYFYEHENKGNRKYFTAGVGLRFNVFSLDFSYLIATGRTSPLDRTIRFTLGFTFE
jgi:hypothetical protein